MQAPQLAIQLTPGGESGCKCKVSSAGWQIIEVGDVQRKDLRRGGACGTGSAGFDVQSDARSRIQSPGSNYRKGLDPIFDPEELGAAVDVRRFNDSLATRVEAHTAGRTPSLQPFDCEGSRLAAVSTCFRDHNAVDLVDIPRDLTVTMWSRGHFLEFGNDLLGQGWIRRSIGRPASDIRFVVSADADHFGSLIIHLDLAAGDRPLDAGPLLANSGASDPDVAPPWEGILLVNSGSGLNLVTNGGQPRDGLFLTSGNDDDG